jgi:hypothetical protein
VAFLQYYAKLLHDYVNINVLVDFDLAMLKLDIAMAETVGNRTLKVLFLKQDTINRVLSEKQDLVGNAWRRLGLKKKGGITFRFPSS